VRVRYSGFRQPGVNMTPIWIIMVLNLLFYIATIIQRSLILSTFGLTPIELGNEPWTIVTNMFVHAGVWHFLGNMLMLYFFGSYLLGLVGEAKFLLVYFAGGLLANVAFLLLGSDFVTVVGASGALYAVMGAMAVMRPRLKVYLWFMIPIDLWIVVVVGMLIIAPGVAWQAHLGGLALGLVAGLFFRKRERGAFWR
jgi:membrane associated rhomboid family serine protease